MATRPTLALLSAALVLGGSLAGCSSQDAPADPTPPATAVATASPDPTPDPTPTADPTPPPDDADALPPGFPDPESLIGQEAYDEPAADGSWHTVIGGVPVELVNTFGACFDGGTGDICGYAISGAIAPGPEPQPTQAGLLLLLRAAGTRADGTATWLVLDAVVTTSPSGEPAYFETCEGQDGVAIYADPDAVAAAGDTIPVLAAWGPDAAVSALVELDPASLTCAYIGD